MSLSQHPRVKKMRRTMIGKLGSLEAYKEHMRNIASLGGQAQVPKGFAKTPIRKSNEL